MWRGQQINHLKRNSEQLPSKQKQYTDHIESKKLWTIIMKKGFVKSCEKSYVKSCKILPNYSYGDSATFVLFQIMLFAFNSLMLRQTLDFRKERQLTKNSINNLSTGKTVTNPIYQHQTTI